ncbi:hypothetical protein F4776DRAFT_663628 [Hypoxylon sp. NC0597]|nr:hypothetical protein F4776DRAFT_663628 [Hypoxylon sp. NC0597]
MKAIISLLVGVVAAGVVPTVEQVVNTSDVLLPEPYTAIPFSMNGAIETGGEVMTFNGTVTDIFKQIQSIKPDFKWDDFQPVARDHILCNVPHSEPSLRMAFLWGHDYLKTLNQPCEVAGGPHKCAKLWCDSGSSIWLCNGNTDGISQDCSYLASYVLDVIGDVGCAVDLFTPGDSSELMVNTMGMEFDTGDWGVLLRHGDC